LHDAGALPASWGDTSSLLPTGLRLNVVNNTNLTGEIPSTWARFKGFIELAGTNVSGCVPDQLMFSVVLDGKMIACSESSKQVFALLELKKLLDPNGKDLSSWNNSTTQIPSPGVACESGTYQQLVSIYKLVLDGLLCLFIHCTELHAPTAVSLCITVMWLIAWSSYYRSCLISVSFPKPQRSAA
jgi:hypothetical protein